MVRNARAALVEKVVEPLSRLRGTARRDRPPRRYLEARAAISQPKSCLFFTTHKCASSFVNEMLGVICDTGPYELCDHETMLWSYADDLLDEDDIPTFKAKAHDHLFRARGSVYSPNRYPFDFPGRRHFRHVFFLRDPRDVLVSAYHSFGFTHAVPPQPGARARFLRLRERIRDMGIDGYAREQCDAWMKPVLSDYRRLYAEAASSIYIRYDDYVADPAWVMERIACYLDTRLDPEQRDAVCERAAPVRRTPDEQAHKRSGASGQFRQALAPDTRAYIDDALRDELRFWRFPAH